MDTMRKCCKDELPKGCPSCSKEDMFGDICHAYQAYEQGRADAFNEILNEMRKSPFASDKATFVKKYIEKELKEKNNDN